LIKIKFYDVINSLAIESYFLIPLTRESKYIRGFSAAKAKKIFILVRVQNKFKIRKFTDPRPNKKKTIYDRPKLINDLISYRHSEPYTVTSPGLNIKLYDACSSSQFRS